MEIELLEARIGEELAAAARDLWAATGADPFARLGAEPPLLASDDTRRLLARAGARGGLGPLAVDLATRAANLHRLALGAAFAAADRARATAPSDRTEAAFLAASRARTAIAVRLGFADVWSLALAISNDGDTVAGAAAADGPAAGAATAGGERLREHLADPARLVRLLADAHGLDASPITSVSVHAADAPEPGRTFIIDPGRDIRVRVWQRPGASAAGTLRVLLHELGHAFLAATWRDLPAGLAIAPSRAFDEATAAWFASQLEHASFARDLLGLSPAEADALADAERAAHAARRLRLESAASSERAFYLSGGPAPWRDALAWTDPGAASSYAAAESLRDTFGPAWPPR